MARFIDNLIVHQNTGTLYITAGKKLLPVTGEELNIIPIRTTLPPVEIFLLGPNLHSHKMRAKHMMLCYSYFYNECWEEADITGGQFAAAMLSLLSNFVDPVALTHNEIVDVFQEAGYSAVIYRLNTSEEVDHWYINRKGLNFSRLLGHLK